MILKIFEMNFWNLMRSMLAHEALRSIDLIEQGGLD
jgi:hypothetical protein